MNHTMSSKVKEHFQKAMKHTRKQLGYTQEAMAEKLHISTKEYGNLERGKCGLSATTMLAFLSTLTDEMVINLLHVCHKELEDDDENSLNE